MVAYFAQFELLPIFRTADLLVEFSHTSLLGRTEVFRAAAAAQDGERSVQKLPPSPSGSNSDSPALSPHYPISAPALSSLPLFLWQEFHNFLAPGMKNPLLHTQLRKHAPALSMSLESM